MTRKTTTRKTVLTIVVAILLYGIISGMRATFSIFTSEISNATGLSYGTISGIFAACNLIFAISCPVFGLLSQKIPIRYILASGATMVAIGLVGTAFSTAYVPLFIFIGVFFGLGAGAICYAMVYAAVTPFLERNQAAVCAGFLCASLGFFNIFIAPFVQTMGSSAVTLTICFVILGAISACLVPICLIFFRKKKYENLQKTMPVEKQTGSFLAPLKYIFTRLYFYVLILGYIAYGLCDGCMINHLYENATGVLNVSPDFASILVMVYGFALIIGPLIGGFIAVRIKNLRLCAAATFGLWVICYTLFNFVPGNNVTLVILVLGMGIASSMLMPLFSILVLEESPTLMFAAILPFVETFLYFGYSFDGYFGGLCYDIYGHFLIPSIITYTMCGVVILLFVISGIRYRKRIHEIATNPEIP